MTTQQLIKDLLPPALLRCAQGALDHVRPAPMEYLPGGWPKTARGWNVESIARVQRERWALMAALQSPAPLGVSPAALAAKGRQVDVWDIIGHNNIMAFAYVLGLAAHGKEKMTMLDWGGGVGYYYALSKALLPGLALDYHCQEVPLLCEIGRRNLPDATFWDEPDACFRRKYDLVFAGSSLWCAPDWKAALGKMAASSDRYVFLNRMIFVEDVPTFVALQRPAAHSYDTEYPLWIFNRRELIEAAAECGLSLVREFLISQGPRLHRAPEQGVFRGLLFERKT
jgi:putative methyltransferase (TIGR04325 family)